MFFSGIGRIKLNGFKDLTAHTEPKLFRDFEFVYIPLISMGNVNIKPQVEVGDYVKVGQVIAAREDHFYVPFFSSVSGIVESIDKMMSPSLVYAQHIKIKNDHNFDSVDEVNFDYENATRSEIVDKIKEIGSLGCGGSGFPTYVKYNSDVPIETLLINGVECEPYITIDYQNMLTFSQELITGIKILLKASEAKQCIIAFKVGKDKLKDSLKPLLDNEDNIIIQEVPDVYPMGWERTLIKELFNKSYIKLPSEIGVIVNNPTTAINIAFALTSRHSHKVSATISGNAIKKPQNVVVPVGTKVADIIDAIGGYNEDVTDNKAKLIMGGPMMGKAIVTDEVALTPYTNAVNVIYDVPLNEVACLRCSKCVEYCPTGLQPVLIKDAEIAQNVEILNKLAADTCVECGLCSYICPSRIQVTDYTGKGKKRVLNSNK